MIYFGPSKNGRTWRIETEDRDGALSRVRIAWWIALAYLVVSFLCIIWPDQVPGPAFPVLPVCWALVLFVRSDISGLRYTQLEPGEADGAVHDRRLTAPLTQSALMLIAGLCLTVARFLAP